MTDKSFGDHTSRNILKNPLLSTAVTGLSIEDLTHNAVLLPVSLSQEEITRPDQQSGPQIGTLGDTEQAVSNFPSGDTNSSPFPLSIPPAASITSYNLPPSSRPEKETENPRATVSKASVKSEDDFDVNEYFARLQGTRYVSAPLNSHLKEDTNEENLEEINLNEPEKLVEQQSLTADIAQNFSQLPTVLPQVASAVFSSFSSMLQVRRSREPTPEARSSGYQEVQFERPSEPMSEYVAPKEPPIMPPTVGTANYRLPTKKKYAQIPGLSSGDNAQVPFLPPPQNMPPMSQNIPPYYVSNTTAKQDNSTPSVGQNRPPTSQNYPQYFVPDTSAGQNQITPSVSQSLPPHMSQNVPATIQQLPPTSQNAPQYFVPNSETGHAEIPKEVDNQNPFNLENQTMERHNAPQYFPPSNSGPTQTMQSYEKIETQNPCSKNAPTYFVPTFDDDDTKEHQPTSMHGTENYATNINTDSKNVTQININTFSVPQNIPIGRKDGESENLVDSKQKCNVNIDLLGQDPNQPVLPPPPMFTNPVKRQSPSDAGKAILPPSIARRISSNQPIIKNSSQVSMITEKEFTPAPLDSFSTLESIPSLQNLNQRPVIPVNSNVSQSAFAPYDLQTSTLPTSWPMSPSSASNVPTGLDNTLQASELPSYPPMDNITSSRMLPTKQSSIFPLATGLEVKQPSIFTPNFTATNVPLKTDLKSLSSIATPNATSVSSNTAKSGTISPPPLFAPNIQTSQIPPSIFTPSFGASTQRSLSSASTIGSSIPASVTPVEMFVPSTEASPSYFNPGTLPPNEMKFQKTNDEIAAPYIENIVPAKVPEPPKASGNVSFRMTKKRPQYYAGPIEGIGAISNNVKPVIAPVNTGTFQGALFTPQLDVAPQTTTALEGAATPFDISCSLPASVPVNTVPFDLSRPVQLADTMQTALNRSAETTYPTYEIQAQVPHYNTIFDTSRNSTEAYNETKQESSGLGLLGSLKSKLSSIDINKIQSSVTTFFDPAYNEPKKEGVQHNMPYEQQAQQHLTAYGQYGQTQENNFEIFVPQVEHATEAYNQTYYPATYQNQFSHGKENQCNQPQNESNYYPNTNQNVASYFSQTPQSFGTATNTISQENFPTMPAVNLQGNVQTGYSTSNLQTELKQELHPDMEQKSNLEAPVPFPQPNNQETQNEKHVKDNYSAFPPYLSQEPLKDLASCKDLFIPETSTSVFGNPDIDVAKYELKANTFAKESDEEVIMPCAKSIAPIGRTTSQKCFEIPQENESQISALIKKNYLPNVTESSSSTKGESLTDSSITSFFDTSQSIVSFVLGQEEKNISQNLPIGFQSWTEEKNIKFDEAASVLDSSTSNIIDCFVKKDIVDLKTIQSPFNDVVVTNIDQTEQKPSYNLFPQSNPVDFFGALGHDTKTQDLFSNLALSYNDPIKLSKLEDTEKQNDYIKDAPQLDVSSAPLFGLSTMLADKTKELNALEEENKKNAFQNEPKDIDNLFNRAGKATFFEDLEAKNENVDENVNDNDKVPDLNICETCREVTKHDDREEDDLTSKLIENITSPIQLSNPVGVPLGESKTPGEKTDDFESNQCAEISHITEETIETIQVQSAYEKLEDEQVDNIRKYGWSEDQDINYTSSFQSSIERGYSLPGLPIDPNAIGFFGGNPLFGKMKISKEELKTDKADAPVVLVRQMSIPTAPPEEDVKSEGIDVHSIEQDANQDFPVFEEFVIEPEEGLKASCESIHDLDSFTSRVDKYKKNENDTVENTSPISDLKSATSPAVHMASYFDTGNYAVESHYRNSLTSPTNQIRVPPGFEDEFQKRLSIQNSGDRNDIPFIPDTSTQTRPIYSPTFSTAQNIIDSTCVTSSKMFGFIPKAVESQKLPDFSSVFKQEGIRTDVITNYEINSSTGAPTDITDEITTSSDLLQIQASDKPIVVSATKNLSGTGVMLESSEEKSNQEPSFFKKPVVKPQEEAQKPLQDHINFFSNVETTDKSAGDQDFSRLASYFSSPAKTDHTKSFFELSQGQNHHRHEPKMDIKPNIDKIISPVAKNEKSNIHNIPPDQYLSNLNLINDLTSYQNPEFKPEQVVRTVNYFTVEYDNEKLTNELNIGVPDVKKEPIITETLKIDSLTTDDKNLNHIVEDCKYCCNFDVGPFNKLDSIDHEALTDYKVRKCMDAKSESKKDTTMELSKQVDKNQSVAVNFGDQHLQADANDGVTILNVTENRSSTEYIPVKHHWFYRIDVEDKSTWRGFSVVDSRALEDALNSPTLNETTVVATDGGRYDVNVNGRLRVAVYWTEKPANVRRCSWFYKGTTDARYVPYTEAVAEKLEEEYRHGVRTGEWHRRLVLPNNELVVMHGPAVMVHFVQAGATDAFSTPPLFAFGKRVYRSPPKIRVSRDQAERIDHLIMMVHGAGEYRVQKEKIQSTMRPRVVRRGCDESEIEEVEPSSIDHLLLLCHGVGSACDMRFRAVEEVVDDFRATSLQLIQSHYRNSYDSGVVGRVEVLPVSWHATLHSGETGVDRRLARITLDSIPRLRSFTNDTVLDVLFYTSPVFCQTIINTVCAEMNRIYKLFRERNPEFKGRVSLGGHSLGSVILYDLLCHQSASTPPPSEHNKRYVSGAAGTGQPSVQYPSLDFSPVAMYALGSPIAIFECIRGVDSLGTDFSLPTCQNFFNIFHPYDPIAYRIEPLLNPQLRNVKPFLIPHHKGRKRMHLELKDTMARVGADIKQKLVESIKSTWSNMWKSQPPPSDHQLEKVVEEEMEKEQLTEGGNEEILNDDTTPEMLGKLNNGRRVDYVLQEAPFEMINEYLFAMSSHVCYWESEDTMLLMLREIYDSMGVQPDCTVPQQSLSVQRTRVPQPEETIVMNASEHPSTSRGAT